MERAWGALSSSRRGAGAQAQVARGGQGVLATASAAKASDSDSASASVAAPCSFSSAAFSKSSAESELEPEPEQRQQQNPDGGAIRVTQAPAEDLDQEQRVQHAEAAAKEDQREQRAEAAAVQHVQRADRGLGGPRLPLTPFALVQEVLGGRPLPARCHIYAGAGCRSFVAKRSGFTVPGSSAPVARHGYQEAAILHAYEVLLRHVHANPQWPPAAS